MILSMLALLPPAHARDVLHEGRPASPPEAFYILGGAHACRVAVVVAQDGHPLAADARACSDVLASALEQAALDWRWERAANVSTELVDVPVRRPAFTPRAGRGACLVAFSIAGTDPAPLTAEHPPRCDVATTPVPAVSLGSRLMPAWCAVDVTADADGVTAVQVDGCSEGFADEARAAIAGWSFETRRTQTWRVLLGWQPDHAFDARPVAGHGW